MADDVTVLVPTLDEAATIEDVVAGFRAEGFDDVLVVDGGSTDGTRKLAREAGARVVEQTGEGKGKAVRQALSEIDREYVLLVDGDGTYRPEDAHRLIGPLREGEAEHVLGNRFADMRPGAMSQLNQLGNRIINWAYRLIHRRDHHDILTGYRAFTLRSANRMVLSADGFGIETEMTVECVKQGIATLEVPITYRPRPEGSETNLHPFRDGGTILLTLYRLAKTNNPFFYFGSVGVASLIVGTATALFVGYRWIAAGISHEVLALGGAAAILLGVQLLIFGALSDMIASLHGDQRRRIHRLERALQEHTDADVEGTSVAPTADELGESSADATPSEGTDATAQDPAATTERTAPGAEDATAAAEDAAAASEDTTPATEDAAAVEDASESDVQTRAEE